MWFGDTDQSWKPSFRKCNEINILHSELAKNTIDLTFWTGKNHDRRSFLLVVVHTDYISPSNRLALKEQFQFLFLHSFIDACYLDSGCSRYFILVIIFILLILILLILILILILLIWLSKVVLYLYCLTIDLQYFSPQ